MVTQYAYHVTLAEFLPSIKEKGLVPNEHPSLDEPGIFFEPDEEEAAIYLDPPRTVMLRWVLVGGAQSYTEDGEYIHFDVVAPENLEMRTKEGWKTISGERF